MAIHSHKWLHSPVFSIRSQEGAHRGPLRVVAIPRMTSGLFQEDSADQPSPTLQLPTALDVPTPHRNLVAGRIAHRVSGTHQWEIE